ncbi:MAG: hypothetical protein ACJ73J_12985 [Actinomycetes bacterium]|jgi:hypothetical protein
MTTLPAISPEATRALRGDRKPKGPVHEPWALGDLLLVDNSRPAHSREPGTGPREVLVGMADPVRHGDGVPGDGSPR